MTLSGVMGWEFCGPVLPLQGGLNCFFVFLFPGLQPGLQHTRLTARLKWEPVITAVCSPLSECPVRAKCDTPACKAGVDGPRNSFQSPEWASHSEHEWGALKNPGGFVSGLSSVQQDRAIWKPAKMKTFSTANPLPP